MANGSAIDWLDDFIRNGPYAHEADARKARDELVELVESIKLVIAVSDRATVEYERAKAALANVDRT